MIEYRIAEVPNSKISKPYQNINYSEIGIPKHKLFRNKNPPKQPIQKQNLRQRSPVPNLRSLTSTTAISHETMKPNNTVKNKTKIIIPETK